MRCIRANHDTKLIMNGVETCVLLLYVTNYAFKKQNRSSNASALIARQLAFHQAGQSQTAVSNDDLEAYNKHLLQRCANTLLTQREFSSPEIISYLMGWGDRFESHKYINLYMDGALRALERAFPGIMEKYVHLKGFMNENLNIASENNQAKKAHPTLNQHRWR